MFGFGDGPALRVSTPFTPIDLPNLAIWLNAPDLSGTDGSSVASWTPSGGVGAVAPAQGVGGKQPLLKKASNGINGLNVVRFDGVDDFMRGQFDPGSTGLTFFAVGRTGPALTTYGTLMGSGGDNFSDDHTPGVLWSCAHGNASDGYGAGWGGNGDYPTFGDVAGIATNQVFYSRWRTNKIQWTIDGPNSNTVPDTTFPTIGNPFHLHVGCGSTNGFSTLISFPFNGDIGELIVCSSSLPDDTVATVKAYLQAKWGL